MASSNNPFMNPQPGPTAAFSDPSVQAASNSSNDASSLPTSTTPAPAPQPEPYPGQQETTVAVPVSSSVKGYQQKLNSGQPLTEAECREWARDLSEREQAVGIANSDGKPYTFPPCGKLACVRGPMPNDIIEDIPEANQSAAKLLLYSLWGNWFCLFWNFICMCIYVGAEDADVSYVFLALLYWIAGSLGAFYLWYKMGYRGLETGSNFLMFLFLCFFAICTLFWAAAGIGVPESALAGFICMVKLFDDGHDGEGLCVLVAFILYCLLGFLMVITFFKILAVYKGSGGTEKTQETVDNAKKAANAAHKAGAV